MMTLSGYSTPERSSGTTNRGQGKRQDSIYWDGRSRQILDSGAQSRFIGRSSEASAVAAAARSRIWRYLPYVAALLLFLLIFSSFWGFSGAQSSEIAPAAEGEAIVTVTRGDTLWSIAGDAGLTGDIRRSVFLIKERNGLRDSTLQAGQTLIIPKHS
jgi:hypothetical protein